MFDILDKEAPENIVIPYATLLNTLLPATNVSIRRHTPKLINLIGSIAKIYYEQLPVVEDNGKKVVVATPEIFWLAWRIGDEAITGAVAGLTERQMRLWKEVLKLFYTNSRIESKTLSEAIGKSTNTALNWLKFFERKGLLTSEFEGRQRFFEKHFEHTAVSTLPALSFAKLEKATKNFLETYSITLSENYKAMELVDPLTGKHISRDFLVESSFALKAASDSKKQRKEIGKPRTAESWQSVMEESKSSSGTGKVSGGD